MRLLSDKSGFGTVYEAFERSTPKILKVLKAEYGSNDKAVHLFQQEALVLGQLSHPGIPAIDTDGYFQYLPHASQEPLHCLVMEKIDGPNLREWMRQQGNHPIHERQALGWLKQLVEILDLVHQKNYFHRDIKPENIMLRPNGQLVLVDFGAAREMTLTYLQQIGKTGGITRISSAGYTPPEQEKGQAVPQSDFYALGCTLIYLLTGKQPTDAGMYDLFNNRITWQEHAPQLSAAFADFLDRLIAEKVSDRPQDTQEIFKILPGLLAPHKAIPLPEPQAAPPVAAPPTLIKSPIAGKKRWMVGSAIALTLLAGGGYGLHQNFAAQWIKAPSPEVPVSIVRNLSGHTSYVNCLAISPDGSTLISGSADTSIKLWDFATGKELRTLNGHTSYVNALAISPDGKILASGGADTTILIWDLATGRILHTLRGHAGFINALSINRSGNLLASGSADGTIKIWDLATGITKRTLRGHSSFVNALMFSTNDRTLFSASADTTIKLWTVDTGEELRTLTGHSNFVNSLAISPDGNTLISSSADKTIKVWDLSTPTAPPRTLIGHTNFVSGLALNADGKTLLSSSGDQTMKVWDLQTGEVKETLMGYGAAINYFVVSPDWMAIASGSESKTIKIWQLPR
jgi:WD40 repeat protein